MSKILVTGGAGFIGSHIVESLVRQGHSVRVLDNLSNGKIENLGAVLKKIDLIKADVRSPAACVKAARGVDFILHQAALRSVPRSLQSPQEYNEVNIGGTLNMLDAAVKNKVERFTFASSSSVYGDTDIFPEKETFSCHPISPYAITKLAGEHYCNIFSRHYRLNCVALRYFNVFGPRQSLDDDYAVVIPKFIRCLLDNKPAPVFGSGRQSRDFTYVSNVVEANMLALKKKSLCGVFNVACGKNYTVLELARILNRVLGKNIPPVFMPERPGDVYKTLADLTSARKFLGYAPKINFLEGLRLTVEYFQKYG